MWHHRTFLKRKTRAGLGFDSIVTLPNWRERLAEVVCSCAASSGDSFSGAIGRGKVPLSPAPLEEQKPGFKLKPSGGAEDHDIFRLPHAAFYQHEAPANSDMIGKKRRGRRRQDFRTLLDVSQQGMAVKGVWPTLAEVLAPPAKGCLASAR